MRADLRQGDTVDRSTFRELMAGFPSGVAVVTTADTGGTPLGLTCSSLCSVSLEPPLLLVCNHNASRTLPAIRERRLLAVNFLHAGGREAAELFAAPAADRFSRVPWRPTPRWRLPGLTVHANAVAECRVRDSTVAGDHTVVVAEVAEVTRVAAAAPLLYGLREYVPWPSAVLRE
jgi:flavin reductase (DIM6/NTAB) family NADH-FMN oxidoreductase RutF